MTIQDWAAVAEMMSGIAIIITLIYLASQIKLARNAYADDGALPQLSMKGGRNFCRGDARSDDARGEGRPDGDWIRKLLTQSYKQSLFANHTRVCDVSAQNK